MKFLGKPKKVSEDGKTGFYHLADIDYDTTVAFTDVTPKATVRYIHFEPSSSYWPKKNMTYGSFEPMITDKHLADAKADMEQAPVTHETGRTLTIPFKDEGIRLTFNNSTKRELKAVLIWPKGSAIP